MPVRRYRVKVETAYHTIAVIDPATESEASWPVPDSAWPGPDEHLWSGHDSAVLMTASQGGGRIVLEVWDEPPPADEEFWEGVCETDLHNTSGAVELSGWDHEDVSRRIPVRAGLHRIRVSVRDLARESGVGRGGELYRVQIHPSRERSGYTVRKQWVAGSAAPEPERRSARPRGPARPPRARARGLARADHEMLIPTEQGAYAICDPYSAEVDHLPRPPRRLCLNRRAVVISTEGREGASVLLELWPASPPDDRARWAWTDEGDLQVESGRLEVWGLTENATEPAIRVPRGDYRVRVCGGDPAGSADAVERHRVQVFPAPGG